MRHERQFRRRMAALVVSLVATLVTGLVAAASPLAGGASSPEGAVRAYLLALERRDPAALRDVGADGSLLADRLDRYGGLPAESVWVRLRDPLFAARRHTAELHYLDVRVPPAHDVLDVVERWGRWYVEPYEKPYVPCEFEATGCDTPDGPVVLMTPVRAARR